MDCNACIKQFLCDRKQCNFKSFLEAKDYGRPKICTNDIKERQK